MPLIFGCITPHGYQVLPELTPSPDEAAPTRAAMQTLSDRLRTLAPETVIVLTPHGVRIEGAMCITVSTRVAGDLGSGTAVDFNVDQPLAHALAQASVAAGVPVAKAIYGGSSGPGCCVPLDWGALIPLRYLGHTFEPKPQVVVVTPSRVLTREQMVQFGRAIGQVATASSQRIALVASADQGHAHQESGPYGFDPAAAEYDRQMCAAVEADNLLALLETDPALVDAAKPDSLWQMLILAGALQVQPMRGELLAYEVPTYFGLLTASYQP